MSGMTSTTPAGWYPDHDGMPAWWDGRVWSEGYVPTPLMSAGTTAAHRLSAFVVAAMGVAVIALPVVRAALRA